MLTPEIPAFHIQREVVQLKCLGEADVQFTQYLISIYRR